MGYLDCFSDYTNPLLLRMDRAEELLQELIDQELEKSAAYCKGVEFPNLTIVTASEQKDTIIS